MTPRSSTHAMRWAAVGGVAGPVLFAVLFGQLHDVTGLLGFVAAIVGMFVLAQRRRDDSPGQVRAGVTRALGLVAIAGLVAFIASEAAGVQHISGTPQQVFVGALVLGVAVTAVHSSSAIARREVL